MSKKAEVSTVPAYVLGEKAAALVAAEQVKATLQAPTKGLGREWRAPGYTAANTRVGALAAVLAYAGERFTAEQAQQALIKAKTEGLNLGTGSPRSYVVAFVKNGYFAPVA